MNDKTETMFKEWDLIAEKYSRMDLRLVTSLMRALKKHYIDNYEDVDALSADMLQSGYDAINKAKTKSEEGKIIISQEELSRRGKGKKHTTWWPDCGMQFVGVLDGKAIDLLRLAQVCEQWLDKENDTK